MEDRTFRFGLPPSFGCSFRGRLDAFNEPYLTVDWRLGGPIFSREAPLHILFPDTAAALVDELDRMFPEKPSTPETTREEDLAYGAKRGLVIFLKKWREDTRNGRPQIVRRQRR